MMSDQSFTATIEFARRAPIDDGTTCIVNDGARPGTGLPVCGDPMHENNLEPGLHDGFIALVESSSFVRKCIQHSLHLAFALPIVTHSSVDELQRQPRSVNPRLVVLSVREPGKEESLHTLKALLEASPEIPVIVLGYKNDPQLARTAICHGAKGYIPFTMEFALAIEAMRFVLAGGTFVPVETLDFPGVAAAAPSAPGVVTNRELAVVCAIQQGKSNKIIAYDLNMSESTVKVHVRNIMKKLKAKNRTDVAMLSAYY